MSRVILRRKAFFSVAGCLLVQLCVGIIYLWSVLKSPYAESFGMELSEAGMVSSYMLTAFVVGALLGGFAVDRKGPRVSCFLGVGLFSAGIGLSALLTGTTARLIYLTYAGLGGLGSGIAYSACISGIQKWMPGRRGLASGLAVGAFGLSTVIFAPVFKGFLGRFTGGDGLVDFGPVFGILAGLFLALGLLGCAMIRTAPVEKVASAADSRSLGQAVRTLPFWCIFLTVFFINGAWNLATPLLYDLGLARGLSPEHATLALSLTGLASAAGRLLMAAVSDKLGRSKSICLLAGLTMAASLAMMAVHGGAYIGAVMLLAFAYGGPSSVNAAITTDYFGPRHSGSIYGVILLALGASSLFFNSVSAHVLGGDVPATFLMAAFSALVPLVLMGVLHVHDTLEKRSLSLEALWPRRAAHGSHGA